MKEKRLRTLYAYLRLVNNVEDDLAFERIINVPKRGIGKSTLSKISSVSKNKNTSLFEASRDIIFKTNSKTKVELYNFIDNISKWKKFIKILIILS